MDDAGWGGVEQCCRSGQYRGPCEPYFAYLVPLVSVAAVGAQILLGSIILPLPAVSPRTATSPALTLLLLLSSCPALARLLLLFDACRALVMLLLLLLPCAPFLNTTSRRVVHVLSGSREKSVATGTTAASRDLNMRRTINTICRLPFPLNLPVHRSYPVLDHGYGLVGGIFILHCFVIDLVIGRKALEYVHAILSLGPTWLSPPLPFYP